MLAHVAVNADIHAPQTLRIAKEGPNCLNISPVSQVSQRELSCAPVATLSAAANWNAKHSSLLSSATHELVVLV